MSQEPNESVPAETPAQADTLRDKIIEELQTVYDPEIPLNI